MKKVLASILVCAILLSLCSLSLAEEKIEQKRPFRILSNTMVAGYPETTEENLSIQAIVELFQSGSETWRGAFDRWNEALKAQEAGCAETEHQYRLLVEDME